MRQREKVLTPSGQLFVLGVSGVTANIAIPAGSKYARVTQTGANAVNCWFDYDQAAVINAQTTIPMSLLTDTVVLSIPSGAAALHAIASGAGSLSVEFFTA